MSAAMEKLTSSARQAYRPRLGEFVGFHFAFGLDRMSWKSEVVLDLHRQAEDIMASADMAALAQW